ncbi:permease, partial [Aliarcobacter butzleri]
LIFFGTIIFTSRTDESIYLGTALIGNTGKLGIPLGIALFGVESVPYTSIINNANVFFMYTISVCFFARERFSLNQA